MDIFRARVCKLRSRVIVGRHINGTSLSIGIEGVPIATKTLLRFEPLPHACQAIFFPTKPTAVI